MCLVVSGDSGALQYGQACVPLQWDGQVGATAGPIQGPPQPLYCGGINSLGGSNSKAAHVLSMARSFLLALYSPSKRDHTTRSSMIQSSHLGRPVLSDGAPLWGIPASSGLPLV